MLFCLLFNLQANIADYGDNQWVTCFQESAEAILGQNAGYLGQLKESVSKHWRQGRAWARAGPLTLLMPNMHTSTPHYTSMG